MVYPNSDNRIFESEDEENWVDPDRARVIAAPALPVEPAPPPAEADGKKASRRGQKKAKDLTARGAAPPGMMMLSADEVGKIWKEVTGGRMTIDTYQGQTVAYVSFDSLQKILPQLLAKL